MPGINDYTYNLRRVDEWLRRNKVPRAAVFDVGTRAARVMVGPKKLGAATNWNEGMFFTAGFVTGLGEDVQPDTGRLPVDKSPALLRLADFMNDTMAVLRANGMPESNILAIGTEVFRSLPQDNLAQVIAWLKTQTGLTIQVLEARTEALLSLIAAQMAHKLNLPSALWLNIANGERFLMIDQGGGSTEISFHKTPQKAHLESASDLGTACLRRLFFRGEAEVDPETNGATIPGQYRVVAQYVDEKVQSYGFPDQLFKMAYGLGTAVTTCFPGVNSWKVHNRAATLEFLTEAEQKRCEALASAYPNVGALYQAIEYEEDDDRRVRLDKEVLVVFGLPVFRSILKKIGLAELRICGFPLRYGAFAIWHEYGLGWDLKPRVQGT